MAAARYGPKAPGDGCGPIRFDRPAPLGGGAPHQMRDERDHEEDKEYEEQNLRDTRRRSRDSAKAQGSRHEREKLR